MKEFVAWARVSSARQKKEGFSLEDQEARLLEFAKRLGGEVVKLFKVAETASKHEEREAFREFTAYVRRHARRLSGMLAVKVDRAARSIQSWAELEALVESTKVPLLFPDQPAGDTPAGRMQRRMSAVFSAYQTDQQATDIRAGHRRRVESGLPLGRQYGFRNVRINGRSIVEHDPVAAPKVKRIFELYAYKGHTLFSLIDALSRDGVVYTDRHPRFDKSVLYRILTNRHYVGEARYQGQWYKGAFDPIVDMATFEAAQARMLGRVFRKPEITFASSLMRCAHCGRVITAEKKLKTTAKGKTTAYSYYRCTRYNADGHPRFRVPERQIEREFAEVFRRLRIDDVRLREWFLEVIRAKAADGQQRGLEHKAELDRQNAVIEAKLKTLLELRIDGEISTDDFSAKRLELHQRQAEIRRQLEDAEAGTGEIADRAVKVFELSQSLENRWTNGDFHAKRELLDILCESVRLNSVKVEIALRKPFDVIERLSGVSVNGAGGNRTPISFLQKPVKIGLPVTRPRRVARNPARLLLRTPPKHPQTRTSRHS